ncbi:RNA ligase family protein [Spirulina sp. 06S082]|uniref:RNA ligase family protein n=1 Tax=Spirulina sp. 06S082 TaxID=3110248 RepID=UPI002B209376|nr:RNA ligase family protein [Spirulina sp. 06S082]MEA5472509.1 RNA ligase family protein [Spirulina sp. 06S082]
MPVIAMEVKKAEQHPNADSLRVYSAIAPGYEETQIVANLENIYEVGDIVAIALSNSILKDGTKIKPSKLRGIQSFGMALGKIVEPIGSDLSDRYCQKNIEKSVLLQKWPSIELLHNVRRNLAIAEKTPKVIYRAKIKLDGTNGGIQIFTDGRIAVQSRSRIITSTSDNAGFAHWVTQNIDFFAKLVGEEHLILFGEWCGKGIQKRTSISQIDRKIFVIFALQYGGRDGKSARLEIDPERISAVIPPHPDIFVLPFFGEPIVLDFGDREQLEKASDRLNQMVEEVERCDPWVKETFGIEGLGEGVVMYPQTDTLVEGISYAELLFKAKGEKHQVIKVKKAVHIDPEVAQNVEEFVELFVTEVRLEQALTEACAGELDMKKMGAFLKWVTADIQKESVAELESAQLTWKDVGKAVMNTARQWYQEKVKLL